MAEGVFVIAEAGVNHNGSFERALKLVDAAVAAGADAVKFQAFKAESLVTASAQTAQYQKKQTNAESQFSMLKSLELGMDEHAELKTYCEQRSIQFMSSPFDLESIDGLAKIGVTTFKIPSGEITNFPYLERIASYGRDVIFSTGMATMKEIGEALEVLVAAGLPKSQITVLHCNTEYPTPFEDVNLRAMHSIGETFGVRVGYSDHTIGIAVPIAAVALGARVIEKHFTLDRNLPGPDHAASLEPQELAEMVRSIRQIEKALGSAEKAPSPSERKNIAVVRKSLVASKDIQAGEVFDGDNITAKRPGGGISPMEWNNVIGKSASRGFKRDELIEL